MPSRAAAQVVTIHDLNFLTHPERTRAEIRRDYPALARAHAHRADAVIVPSPTRPDEVERLLDVPRDRICDLSSRRAGVGSAADGAGRRLRAVFRHARTAKERRRPAGRVRALDRRGPAQARTRRNSAPRVPELVLAGRATDEAQPWLDRISRPPLRGVVRHIGYVDADDRRALYEGARLLVQPSFDEGFGMPVLEAMTIGVPVVAANRGALPESARRRRPAGRSRSTGRHRTRDRADAGRRGTRRGVRRARDRARGRVPMG